MEKKAVYPKAHPRQVGLTISWRVADNTPLSRLMERRGEYRQDNAALAGRF
jgi:hypothetical protein